jgi:hypothetical protein
MLIRVHRALQQIQSYQTLRALAMSALSVPWVLSQ